MLILLSGKARAGKDVFSEFLGKVLYEKTGNVYIMMAYAKELKERVQRDFDLSYDQLWGDDKEVGDKRYRKDFSSLRTHGYDANKVSDIYWTSREIMQNYGEFFRSIDYNYWVKALFSTIEDKEYKNVIITDGRYPNEINAIKDRKGYHIRIKRDEKNSIHNKNHSSETSLDGCKSDITINNNGTLVDLKNSADDASKLLISLEKIDKCIPQLII